MPTTKYKIAEQIKELIKGSDPSVASNIHTEGIMELVGQLISAALKAEYFTVTLPSGNTIPSGYMLCVYDNNGDGYVTEKWKDVSRVKLPAKPILLPKNCGLTVFPNDCPDDPFIPVENGQFSFIKQQPLISDILGQAGVSEEKGYAVFTKDISPDPVMFKIVVGDLGNYGEFDILPVPADMEAKIVMDAVNVLKGVPLASNKVDSTSAAK